MKKCLKCNFEKLESDFSKNKHRKDGFQIYCKACMKKINALHYQKDYKKKQREHNRRNQKIIRDKINFLKSESGCCSCGELESCCLDFHHINADKEFNI